MAVEEGDARYWTNLTQENEGDFHYPVKKLVIFENDPLSKCWQTACTDFS